MQKPYHHYLQSAFYLTLLALVSIPSLAQDMVLEEVTVTAQKRAQNLNDVGISISAISGEDMQELGVFNTSDLARITPGLVVTESQPTNVPIYTIRGIGFDDYSIGSNSTVGFYVDEVALPYPAMTQGIMFDIERVEVLKGPQGTLYGRNSTGGAINVISNKPTREFEAGISLDVGRYELVKTDAYISGGLSDTVSARLAVTGTRRGEGWQRSVSTGDKLGEIEEFGARAILQWLPVDSVELTFNLHANRNRSDGRAAFVAGLLNTALSVNYQPGIATTNDPTLYPVLAFLIGLPLSPDFAGFADPLAYAPTQRDPRAADWGLKPTRDNDAFGASITLLWDINDTYQLVSITGYDEYERSETQDWDGTPLALWDNYMDSDIDSLSQEIRLSFDKGADLTWIAGLYLSTDSVTENMSGDVSNTGIGGAALGFNRFLTKYEQDTDTFGLYGHAEWQFADQFRLTLGLRYTNEDREWTGCTYDVDGDLSWLYNNIFGLSKPGFIPFNPGECLTIDGSAVNPETGEIANPVFNDTLSTDNVSGKIGLDWFPTDNVLMYASISSGFKSGGYNGSPANDWSQQYPYLEEKLLAYEAGVKATLLEGAMQLNGAMFYYDYEDKQVLDSVATLFGPLTRLTNVPKSRVSGVEVEWQWLPLEGLDIGLTATWLDSEVKEYVDFYGDDLSGRDLAQTPKLQYAGIVAYEFGVSQNLSLRLMTDFNYSDRYFTVLGDAGDSLNYLDMQVDDWFIINARVTLLSNDGRWQVAAWGRNLGDEFYTPTKNVGNDIIFSMAGIGLTYGLNFTYQW